MPELHWQAGQRAAASLAQCCQQSKSRWSRWSCKTPPRGRAKVLLKHEVSVLGRPARRTSPLPFPGGVEVICKLEEYKFLRQYQVQEALGRQQMGTRMKKLADKSHWFQPARMYFGWGWRPCWLCPLLKTAQTFTWGDLWAAKSESQDSSPWSNSNFNSQSQLQNFRFLEQNKGLRYCCSFWMQIILDATVKNVFSFQYTAWDYNFYFYVTVYVQLIQMRKGYMFYRENRFYFSW